MAVADSSLRRDVVCPFCGLACDDLAVAVEDGRIIVREGGCDAGRAGFDWPDPSAVLGKVREEVAEIADEMTAQAPAERIGEEIGDLIFAAAQLARHHQINPETALRDANARFERRFRYIERKLSEQGRAAADATMDELEALWVEAKGAEARK